MKDEFLKHRYYIDTLLIFVTMIWGLKPTIMKASFIQISPMQYNVWRIIFAAVSSWIFLFAGGAHVKVHKEDIKQILLISVCGFFIFQWLYAIGLSKTTAGNASIIMGTLPLIVAVINHFSGHEKINRQKAVGISISFIGIMIVIIGTGTVAFAIDNITGGIYIFISAIGYAIYMVFSKPLSTKYPPKQITAYAITVSAVLILIFSGFDINVEAMTMPLFFSLLYTGLIAMYFANFLWTWAIKRSNSSKVSLYNNLTPAFSIVFAALFLREKIGIIQFFGILVIFIGLYVSIYRKIIARN